MVASCTSMPVLSLAVLSLAVLSLAVLSLAVRSLAFAVTIGADGEAIFTQKDVEAEVSSEEEESSEEV